MTDTGPHDMRYLLHEIIKDEHTWKLVDDLMKVEDITYSFVYNTKEQLHHVTFRYLLQGCKHDFFSYLIEVNLYKDNSLYIRILHSVTENLIDNYSLKPAEVDSIYHEVIKSLSKKFSSAFNSNLGKLRDLEGLLVNHLTREILK